MFRWLMSRILRADLAPGFNWPEPSATEVLARISIELPQPFLKVDTREQLLSQSGDEFVLYKRWTNQKGMALVRFRGPLDGNRMRLSEWLPEPNCVYRLQLCPVDESSVVIEEANPTWFELWRNETDSEMGGGICFIDSTNRNELKELRARLLGGEIPESLKNEEKLWERMSKMSEEERRSAMATLTMKHLAEVDRKFQEMHPDAGPVPETLKPAHDVMQQQIKSIDKIANTHPLDPELDGIMQKFVGDAINPPAETKKAEDSPPS